MSLKHAILGHLVRHPDYGYRLTAVLAQELDLPTLNRSAVYQALGQLEKDKLIRSVQSSVQKTRSPGSGRDRIWFEATEAGARDFDEWLRTASQAVPPPDELHRKLLVSTLANLPELIELTWEKERACLDRLGDLEAAAKLPAGERRAAHSPHDWPAIAAVLVRNSHIAHLQTTVRSLQRARDVMVRLRDETAGGDARAGVRGGGAGTRGAQTDTSGAAADARRKGRAH